MFDLSGVQVEDKFGVFSRALVRAFSNGRYERLERMAIEASLQKGDRVLELGAGCGVTGVAAAQIVGAKSVTSVEANPTLIPTIRHIHDINGASEINLINALASGRQGKQDFYVSEDFWASSLDPETPAIKETVNLDVVDINALIKKQKSNVLICDIEGAEFDLFEEIDLRPIDLVIIELHPTDDNFDQVARFFRTMILHELYPDIQNGVRATVQIFKRETRKAKVMQ